MSRKLGTFASLALVAAASVAGAQQATPPPRPSVGRIERLDPALDALIDPNAAIEQLATGFEWSEGPVWRASGGYLLFSDVPRNTIFKWQDASGLSVFLRPAGYTGINPPGRELGSNGLTLDANDSLVMADHGNRQVARLNEAKFTKTTLADRFEGKRLNSPNDLAYRSNGDLYFTDPPYGLTGQNADPAKELRHNGVYRLTRSGQLTLLTSEISFPNGIAFSPDERTLYVASSDPNRAIWMAYDVRSDGTIGNGRVFFDATSLVKAGNQGLPDGMKVDRAGNLFASGPGGILIFSRDGKHLGTIATGQPTANCAFGDDGSTLYMTANDRLLRVRLRTKGAFTSGASRAANGTAGNSTSIREGYVTTSDSARLFYRVMGRGGDTLIAIHGGPGVDLESIAGDFAPLAERHVVIFYDQRGAGRSELPKDTLRLVMSRQIADLDEVRRYFGAKQVTLVAHSYGPLLAASYALAHPEAVRRMVFFGPVPPRRGNFWQRFGASMGQRLDSTARGRQADASRRLSDPNADTRQACRDYWAVGMPPRLAEPARTLALIKSDLCASDPAGIRYGLTVTNRVVMASYGDWDLRERLRRLDVPALVVHGEQDSIPMDLVEEWVTSLPHARLVRVPNAAHFPYAERPELVWPQVERFLAGGGTL
jgi:sugar lactone lactonase YvrE/pimeloyl-ACP methyl ester carboxylesterase